MTIIYLSNNTFSYQHGSFAFSPVDPVHVDPPSKPGLMLLLRPLPVLPAARGRETIVCLPGGREQIALITASFLGWMAAIRGSGVCFSPPLQTPQGPDASFLTTTFQRFSRVQQQLMFFSASWGPHLGGRGSVTSKAVPAAVRRQTQIAAEVKLQSAVWSLARPWAHRNPHS